MSITVGQITIEMSANIARLQQDMARARNTVDGAVGAMTRTVGIFAKALAGLSLGAFIKSSIDALDNLNDLSLKTGIAASKLAGLQLAAKQSGTDLTAAALGINKLSVNIAKNGDAFRKLGIDAKEPLEAFIQLAGVLERIEDPQIRAAVATQALGKGWLELAPLLAMGAQGLRDTVKAGMEMSGVTDQAAKDADEFNDRLEEMTGWLGSIGIRLVGPVIDGFNQLAAHIRATTESAVSFSTVMQGIFNFAAGKDALIGVAKQLRDVNDQIDAEEKKVAAIKSNGLLGGLIDDIAGTDINVAKNKLDDLYKHQEELANKLKSDNEKLGAAPLAQPIDKKAAQEFIGVQQQKAAAKNQATKSIISDSERESIALGKAFDSEMQALELRNVQLSQSARDYEIASLQAKNFSDEMIAQAMIAWDINAAWEAKKQNDETQKTTIDQLIDSYHQLTLSARDYFQLTLINKGISPENQKIDLAQFDKNAAMEASKKSIDDANQSLKSYVDSINSANVKTSDLGSITSGVFDGALGGINLMVGAFDTLINTINASSSALKENAAQQEFNSKKALEDKTRVDPAIFAKQEIKLNDEVTQAKLSATRQVASALSGALKQGSTEQRAAHAVEMGIAGAQLAMNLQKLFGIGAVTAAEVGSVGPSIAASTAKGTAKAAEAVATQASAGPYIGFALMAAMAVAMAAIGFSVGGTGGATVPIPKGSPDTGTVLGDSTAVSDSTNKVYELLKTIHAEEYAELRGINSGVRSLAGGITDTVTKLFQKGGLVDASVSGLGTKINGNPFDPLAAGIGSMLSKIPLIGGLVNSIHSFLFGKTTKSITGGGIATAPISIADTLSGNLIGAAQYNIVETKKTGGLFGKSKTSYDTVLSQIDGDVQNSLTQLFKSVGETMVGLAGSLGDGVTDRVKNYVIPTIMVELRGLSGEDAAKKLNGVISTAIDKMAGDVFGDIIGQYQKLGEGMLETAVRIVSEVAVVNDAVFTVSGKKLKDNAIAISDALVQAAGGLEEFQKQFSNYYDKFYTDAEKQNKLMANFFGQLAGIVPDESLSTISRSREGYRQVIEALDLSNEKDRERASLLLKLADTADAYYKGLEAAQKAALDSANAAIDADKKRITDLRGLETNLMAEQGNAAGALATKRQDELAAMDGTLQGVQLQIYAAQDAKAALATAATAVDQAFKVLQKSVMAEKDAITATYNAQVAALTKANNDIAEAFKVLEKSVAAERKDITDTYNAQVKTTQAAIDKLGASVSKLASLSQLLKNSLAGLTAPGGELSKRLSAQADIKSALAMAKSGGAVDQDALGKALGVIAQPSENLFGSFEAYQRDFYKTATDISDLSKITDTQLTAEQQMLDAAKATLDQLKVNYDGEMARLDAIISTAQAQIDAANGTTVAVMSTTDALSGLSNAIAVQAALSGSDYQSTLAQLKLNYDGEIARLDLVVTTAQQQIDAANGTTIAVLSVEAAIAGLAGAITGQQEAAAAEQARILDSAKALQEAKDASEAALAASIAAAAAAKAAADAALAAAVNNAIAQVPPPATLPTTTTFIQDQSWIAAWNTRISLLRMGAIDMLQWNAWWNAENDRGKADVTTLFNGGTLKAYAAGGNHDGGWRIVGEHGPELENTGPSRIYSNTQSKSLLDNGEILNELKMLRADLRAVGAANISSTEKIRAKLDQFDFEGMPETRTL